MYRVILLIACLLMVLLYNSTKAAVPEDTRHFKKNKSASQEIK